jgi:hypothetical protein
MNIFYKSVCGVQVLGSRPFKYPSPGIFSSLWFIVAITLSGVAGAVEIVPGGSPNWPQYAPPAARGSSTDPFSKELPIARWSRVQFQSFATKIPIGLVAFHGCGQALGNEGIEKVEFIANNGDVTTVNEPSPNPETGLWEWWAYLNPRATDGIVEVRAIIYPYNGLCRILQSGFVEELAPGQNVPSNEQSLVVWSNKSGTYTKPAIWVSMTGNDEIGAGTETSPYRTIGVAVLKGYQGNADFGRIYLGKGTYPMHRGGPDGSLNTKGWLSIEAAPGLQPNEVFIGGNQEDDSIATRYRLVCFRNLSLDYSVSSTHTIFGPSIYYTVNMWFDGAVIKGSSNASSFGGYFANANMVAFTRSPENRLRWLNWNSGPVAAIVSGVDILNTSGDVFSGASFIRDWSVTKTSILSGQHPDLWQSYGGHSNRILMDGKIIGSDTELIFLDGGLPANADIAMVNVVLATTGGGASHISSECKNVLLWNIELTGQPLVLYPAIGNTPTFGAFGCIFPEIAKLDGTDISNFSWTCNQFGGAGMSGSLSATLNPEYNELFAAQKALEIPKRTVRWDADQKERMGPFRCGAYASSNQSIQIIPSPVQGLRIIK